MGVQVAGSGLEIERGARFVVSEIGEGLFCLGSRCQHASVLLPGKAGRQPLHGAFCPHANFSGPFWVCAFEFRQSAPKPRGIELADLEHPDTALGTSRTARQEITASDRIFSERRVHDLDQLTIVARQGLIGEHVVKDIPKTGESTEVP